MTGHYGLRLNLSNNGAAYLSQSGCWRDISEHPMVFKSEDEAASEAFVLIAFDNDWMGKISVVRLIPGVHQWFVE